MCRRVVLATLAVLVGLIASRPPAADAGAYLFTGGDAPNLVVHPPGYFGTGAHLEVSICIAPGSAYATQMVGPLQNIVATFNALEATVGNIFLGNSNNIPNNHVDFESVALHEIGHCLGLAHPNAGTESGLAFDDRRYARAAPGPNGVFDLHPGADGVRGSRDDLRGDDINLLWFRRADNDPFVIGPTVDATTYARDLALLPPGDSFAATGSREVSQLQGLPLTEAVMQQLTYVNEAQRTLAADDVAALRFAMSGLDRTQGTADDYTFALVYAGMSSSCDIVVSFSTTHTSFAQCNVWGSYLNANHIRLTAASAWFNPDFNWFFNPAPTPAATPTATWTPTGTPTATWTPSGTPTATWTPSATPTATWTPSATPTATWTPTGTPTATWTPSWTATSTPTPTFSPEPTPSLTFTPAAVLRSGAVVHFASGAAVAGVEVVFGGGSTTTDSAGLFSVEALTDQSLELAPRFDAGTPAGTALDAVRILELATGLVAPAPAQPFACDASGNGAITAFDALLVLRRIVGLEPELPVAALCGSNWAFLPVPGDGSAVAVAPEIGAGHCSSGRIFAAPPLAAAAEQNFLAVPFGDCSGQWGSAAGDEVIASDTASDGILLAGPLHGRPRQLRFPIGLAPDTEWRGVELTVRYDAEALAFARIRRVGPTRHAVFAANATVAGEVRIAIARAEASRSGIPPLLVIHFEPRTRTARHAEIQVEQARIDGAALAATLRRRPAPAR